MSKKFLVLGVFVLLILVAAGGFFWWWQGREIKGSPEDYVIVETPEGKFVENKKAGLSVKVPEGWEIKKMGQEEGTEEGAVSFFSPDTEIELREGKKSLPLENGCLIIAQLIYEELGLGGIAIEARYTHSLWGVRTEEFEEITLNSYQALKSTFDTQATGPGVGLYIPKGDKVLWLNLFWAVDAKERCDQEFDRFLETISIK